MPANDLRDSSAARREQVHRGLRWPDPDSAPFEMVLSGTSVSISLLLDRQQHALVIERTDEGAVCGAIS